MHGVVHRGESRTRYDSGLRRGKDRRGSGNPTQARTSKRRHKQSVGKDNDAQPVEKEGVDGDEVLKNEQ